MNKFQNSRGLLYLKERPVICMDGNHEATEPV
jgi:hypothetical protein